jgi:hypothetical protein
VERGDEQLDFAVHNLHIPKALFGSFLLKHPDWHPDTHSHETGRRLHAPHLPQAPERFSPAGSWILHRASRGIDRSPLPSSSSDEEDEEEDDADDAADDRRAPPPPSPDRKNNKRPRFFAPSSSDSE